MLFNSISYLVFFPLVVALFWSGPRAWRLNVLLLASYVFYMSWLPQYGLLLLLLTIANYLLGRAISKATGSKFRLLLLGLILNLGTLSWFKYANFLLQSFADGLALTTHLRLFQSAVASAPAFYHLNIILPLGISFFAFEFIHYLTDVYKGSQPIGNFRDFALFAAFFPSQIAGPIKRYQDFRYQLEKPCRFEPERMHAGIALLLQGLFKKVALSDNLANLVEIGFRPGIQLGAADTWLAILAFALQIYLDFSGYTDMGRGSALILGFSLPDNFNLPYIAANLSDFWKRWHISLSTWLRDYLYIPLGGGRCSKLRKYVNLITTMLLGGLWHGAAWHFVAWGGFHGAGLVVCHEYDEFVTRSPLLQRFHATRFGYICSAILTFFAVLVGWVLFRAVTVTQALGIIQRLFSLAPSGPLLLQFWHSTLPVGLSLYLLYVLLWHSRDERGHPITTHSGAALPAKAGRSSLVQSLCAVTALWSWYRGSLLLRVGTYLALLITTVGFAPSKVQPFIYFQF